MALGQRILLHSKRNNNFCRRAGNRQQAYFGSQPQSNGMTESLAKHSNGITSSAIINQTPKLRWSSFLAGLKTIMKMPRTRPCGCSHLVSLSCHCKTQSVRFSGATSSSVIATVITTTTEKRRLVASTSRPRGEEFGKAGAHPYIN